MGLYFGLAGCVFAAHFLYLHAYLKHAPLSPDLAKGYWGSLFAWFIVDSVGCALAGAWFNIFSINVVCILGALGCWIFDRRRALA